MKKLLFTLALAAAALMPGLVLAQTVQSQSTLIITPYGGPGFIVSTTTANGGKLQASSTPYFANFFSGNGTINSLTVGSCSGCGSGTAFPFTPNAASVFFGQVSNSTTTQIHFGGTAFSLTASSTSVFANASTTMFSVAGSTWLSGLTSGTLNVDSLGLVYKTATSTPTVTAPITYGGTLGQFVGGVSGAFGCTNASSGVTGCLTGTDWNTFNGKESVLTFGWPLVRAANNITFNGTTTPWGINGFVYTNAAGLMVTAASSSLNLPNTALTNSTISGVALGGSLFAHTVSGSITGTSYNGSAAVSDWALNMANSNVWTALQRFSNSTTTLADIFSLRVGRTATTTIDGTGNIVVPSGSNITVTGKADGCATYASGVINSTGSACGGAGSSPGLPLNAFQYNNATTFGGVSNFFFNSANGFSSVGGSTTPQLALFSVVASSTGQQIQNIFAVASSSSSGTTTLFSVSPPTPGADIFDVFSTAGAAFLTIGSTGSTTVGAGAQATGLTINGGATSTGFLTVLDTGTSTFSGPISTPALTVTGATAGRVFYAGTGGYVSSDASFKYDGAGTVSLASGLRSISSAGLTLDTSWAVTMGGITLQTGNTASGNGNGYNIALTASNGGSSNALGGNILLTPGTGGVGSSGRHGKVGIASSTPTSLLSIHAIDTFKGLQSLFSIGSSTGATNFTLFDVSNTGSTTLFQIPSQILKTNAGGVIVGAAAGSDYVAPATTISVLGTTNQITSSAGAQDLTTNRAWTLSIPSLFVIQQASTTQFSSGRLTVGLTASTTIDGTGNVVLPSGANLTITGKSDGCATFATGVLNSTGTACGSGGAAAAAASTTASFVIYSDNAQSTSPANYYLYNATSTAVTSSANFQTLLAQAVASLGGVGSYTGVSGAGGKGPGGKIYIAPGTYYTAATTTINGNDQASTGNGPGIFIAGAGQEATKIIVNNSSSFVGYDHVAIGGVSDMAIYTYNGAHAITATSSATGARSLWQFSFKNLLLAATTTSTAPPIWMGNILRGTFENIEFYRTGGCAKFYAEGAFNPGDFTVQRSFCELPTTAGLVAFEFASTTPTGFMNQVHFNIVEGIGTAATQTFIKSVGLSFSTFDNINAEQFDVLVDGLYNTINNEFRFHYATQRNGIASLRGCRFWLGASGNLCSARSGNFNGSASIAWIDDMNTFTDNPNMLEGYIGQDAGTASASTTANGLTVIRDIRGYGTMDTNLEPDAHSGTFQFWGTLKSIGTLAIADFRNAIVRLAFGTAPTLATDGDVGIDSTADQFKFQSSGSTHVLVDFHVMRASMASTTWGVGTTTLIMGPAMRALTFKQVYCETDTGTLQFSLNNGTTRSNFLNASTTRNLNTLSTNVSFAQGASIRVDIGTPASSPKSGGCDFSYTYDAQ